MRAKYVWRDGKLVEVTEDYRPKERIQIIDSNLDLTAHPISGKRYTSKRKFREETRAHGCVELGDQEVRKKEYEPSDAEITDAIDFAYTECARHPSEKHLAPMPEYVEHVDKMFDERYGPRR